MIEEDGCGSVTKILFSESDTEKGRARLQKLYDFFNGCDDEEIAKKINSEYSLEDFDEPEDYEFYLLEALDVQKFCHEKCKLIKVDDDRFRLEWYTYYDTPTALWDYIAKKNRWLVGEGGVTRTFDDRRRYSSLVIAGGRFFYDEPPYGDEDYYIYGD